MPGFFLVFFALLLTTTTTTAYQAKLVSSLLKTKQTTVDKLAMVAPGSSEMTRLRFALAFPSQAEATRALKATIAWRAGPGKSIVEAASKAVVEATRNPGEWDNEPVRLAAPHAKTINQFITPKNILTLSSGDGDLVYIIRASAINDGQLMRKVSVKQLSEFFAYVKEVHSIVANARSERTGRLCEVIFANDISGIRLPPNSKFSEALTSSSKQYEQLYPSLAGPTMILNLPLILQAFIALFKPLFPKSVQDRLLFERAPFLASQKELTPLTTSPKSRDRFLAEVQKILR
ncbi:hypothetical protein TrRE_jg3322 [Triparma retinervis]|uniref:CRAL-TRIO domain-containing protein n=1 Tax=Triparma retinervis TaxID=2557542 RepID=A0A9W6ZNR5_9STRA|nr:hypothetical protein TrRE_jg3322 [Triparma retinervis]